MPAHDQTVSGGAALADERRQFVEAALAAVNAARLQELLVASVDIPSPTGHERPLAEFLADHLARHGLDAKCQVIDGQQANTVGRIRGDGSGLDLLLYAPLDAGFSGDPAEDIPWLGDDIRADFKPSSLVQDGLVIGAGAENPKGYAACVIAAAEAVATAGVPLKGDLIVDLGAGGMPANAHSEPHRHHAGQGSGCAYLLEHGAMPDFAVIAKPGWAVSWEEVGLCWFKVTVRGTLNYTGIRHVAPYVNPIVEAAHVIEGLERWFAEYSERHASGLVEPQGSIGAIRAGWSGKPAFVPASCELLVDVRIGPTQTVMQLQREFAEAIERIRRDRPSLQVDWELILSIPGTHTPPENWIVQSAIRAWETVAGQPHALRTRTSGATDAAILRGHGVPTARVGMPRFEVPQAYSGFSMGVCDVAAMRSLVAALIHIALDTCTRTMNEVRPV